MKKDIDAINEPLAVEKPKRKRNVTEEEREKLRERVKMMREVKSQKIKEKVIKEEPNTYHNSLKSKMNKLDTLEGDIKSMTQKLEMMMKLNEKNKEEINIKEELSTEKISQKKLEEDMYKQKKELEEAIIKEHVEKKIDKEKEEKAFLNKYNVITTKTIEKPVVQTKYTKLPYNIKTVKERLKR